MTRTAARRAEPTPALKRKNMRLNQTLLDEAKRALGTESETEAVTLALRRVAHNARMAAGMRALAGRKMFDESLISD